MRNIIFCLITLLLYVSHTTRAAQVVSENFDNNFNESGEFFGHGNFTIGESPNRAVFTGSPYAPAVYEYTGIEEVMYFLDGASSAFWHSSPGFWYVRAIPGSSGLEVGDEEIGVITFETPPAKVEFYAARASTPHYTEAPCCDGTIEVYDSNGYLISTITNLPITINPAGGVVPELISLDANELGAPHGIGKILVKTTDRVSIDDFQYTPIVFDTTVQAPTITTQPLSQELVPQLKGMSPQTGTSAFFGATELTVVASGNDLTYQWYFGLSGDTTTPVFFGDQNWYPTDVYSYLYPSTIVPWSVTSADQVQFTPIGTTAPAGSDHYFETDFEEVFTLVDYPVTDQSDKYTGSFTLGESPYSATFTGGSVGRPGAVSAITTAPFPIQGNTGPVSSYSGLYSQHILFRQYSIDYHNFYENLINQGLTISNEEGMDDQLNDPYPLIDVLDPKDAFWFISNGETATITFETPVKSFSWDVANFLGGDATVELHDANGTLYAIKTGFDGNYDITGFTTDMNSLFGTYLLPNGDTDITFNTGWTYSKESEGIQIEDVGGIIKIVLKDNEAIFKDVGAYNFWVQVSNEGGRTDSDTAVITVLDSTPVPLVLEGSGEVVGEGIMHPSGLIYDQILLTGESIKAAASPGHITRVSFLDVNGDIVQVEFTGAGNFTLTLDPATYLPPAFPAFYNQNVKYVTGKPSIVIDGADLSGDWNEVGGLETSTTYLSIFTVGKINAMNQSLFPEGQIYDGQADVKLVEIINSEWMGGLQLSNTVFSGSSGKIGVDARGVNIYIRLLFGDIDASGTAVPYLLFDPDSFDSINLDYPLPVMGWRITGGDLLQTNGAAVVIAENGSTTPGFETLISQNNFKSDNTPLPTLSIAATFANEDGDPITVTTEEITIE